jgi:hypothetical protein
MLRVLLMLAVLGRLEPGGSADAAPPLEEPAEAATAATEPSAEGREDPNHTRLMFAPTGRPLRRGEGYFSDHELAFPGFAVGLTDNFSLAGGVSMVPGLGLGEQLTYISPKLGWQLSDRAAVSVGALVVGAGGFDNGAAVGVGFAVGTFGSRDASLTVGLGAARELDNDHGETAPIVVLGGQVRLSDSVALVSESWLRVGGGARFSEQPFGLAVRFFGERLSADVGVVLIGDVLDEGFPVPWVSVSYHFRRDRPRD